MSPFYKKMENATASELSDELGDSEKLLDMLLLALHQALWLQKCDEWSNSGVANLPHDETLELAKWFMKGQSVGRKPLVDGICANCGCLLYGTVNGFALSNKNSGPPTDRDGAVHDDPAAQPPFLLRFSPRLFAREVPAIFEHDPASNRLRLKGAAEEPWLRKTLPHQRANPDSCWLYCHDCHDTNFGQKARQRHIPFRDKASQGAMREPQGGGR